MLLRPYQQTALDAIRLVYASGKRRPLLCSPTGSGKSAMTRYMLERTTKRTLILCHRAELLEMISDSLPVPHSVIGRSNHLEKVCVGMMQTVSRRLDKLPAFDWVISDECHLAMAPTWLSILKHYDKAWHLGMSATPCRLDGKGLGETFDAIVYGPSIGELTARGYLSPCRVFAPAHELAAIRKSGSDYNMEDAATVLNKPQITGSAMEHLRRIAPGRQAIVFCCNRVHADDVAAQFRGEGISAVNIDGSMSDGERKSRLGAYLRKEVQVLTNVELLTTGFDCPQIEVEIMLRPTQSLALYLQMVGRVLRINPGKADAVLLDHVGNVLRHGMPDEAREWTLEGRAKRLTPPPVRQCPKCYAAFRPAPKCPACDYVFPIELSPRQAAKQRAGELEELQRTDPAAYLKTAPFKDVVKQAKTLEALQAIAKARGYDHRWARRMWAMKSGQNQFWRKAS
jgi:superfamily II DNA or RNA helicase